jgi:hypothetical protein
MRTRSEREYKQIIIDNNSPGDAPNLAAELVAGFYLDCVIPGPNFSIVILFRFADEATADMRPVPVTLEIT